MKRLGLAFLVVLSLLMQSLAYEVTVSVSDSLGSPIENATVLCYNETASFMNFTNEQGIASFSLSGGSYIFESAYELALNSTEIEVSQDLQLNVTLDIRTLTLKVLNPSGETLSEATVNASANGLSVVKRTDENGATTLNTSFGEVRLVISREGYATKSVTVNVTENSEVFIVLPEKKITFYLGSEENYDILKEFANESEMVEVFMVGEEVDFANKSLLFLANVNESVCRGVVNETSATVVSFNASAGYSDENVSRYWVYGGRENLMNLVNYLRAKFFGDDVSFEGPKLPEERAKILFILDRDSKQIPLIANASRDLYVEKNLEIKILGYSSNEDLAEAVKGIEFDEYSVVFLYMLGYPAQDILKDYLLPLKSRVKIAGLGFTDVHNLTNVNVSEPEYKAINDYWTYGGIENFKRLLIFLGVKLCNISIADFGLSEIPPPLEIPPYGIYHPKAREEGKGYGGMGIFLICEDYRNWYKWKNAPTIGIHYYYVNDPSTYSVIDSLISKLEELGANVVFTSFTYKDPNSTNWFLNCFKVDSLITLTSFRLWSHDEDEGIEYLQRLNVTPIKAIMEYYYNVSEWEQNFGLNPSSIAWQIALPELDGLTEFIIVGAKNKTTKDYDPIDYQIEWVAKRAMKWAELHRKENGEKKVAIIYYNHGGGKDNIGASYLDVPASLEVLLKAMKERGYAVNAEFDKDLLIKLLTTQGINIGTWRKEEIENLTKTAVLISAEKYEQWFNELPDQRREEVVRMWGPPPGEIMVYTNESGKFIVIPLINLGNVILLPQPTRGYLENQTALYHDKALPPHHQYIAFYFWLTKEFKADAIVHFGTHGTQEWLPGKETGLSVKDSWPAILIQDLPVVYPYIMDNVGEGTQAKRRGQAVIVDHLTPPLVEGSLYGNLSLLHEKIHEYFQAQEEAVKEEIRKTIVELYKELELERVLGSIEEKDFDSFLQNELHEYLHELSSTLIPYGLHTLGVVRSDKAVEFVKAMLGKEFKEEASAVKEIAEPKDEEVLLRLIEEVINGTDPEEAQKKWLNRTNESITNYLRLALKYYYDLLNCTIEVSRTLDALEGKYVPPKIGGDPVRKPDALPTGNNFYSFDPRTIPTKEAWNVAVKLVDDLLSKYYEEHGKFPEKVAYVLWATETMRNYGVMQAAVLYTMGVRPVWDSMGRVKDVELISLDELKLRLSDGSVISRPRIDVTVVSSGLHRDTFSALIRLIDKAVQLCINTNEDASWNYVKKHYLELKNMLIDKSYDESEADELARVRIFSESPGNYGTGLPDAIAASNTWESDAKLAELFINRGGYAYGSKFWGIEASEIFGMNLKNVAIAVHSRSTNLFAALDNDDVFQYLGGIALAVRHLTGSNPETYIFDARNPNEPKVRTLGEFVATEILSRYFNPRWIEGAMENDYAGAKLMAEVVENLWGWEVTMPELISDKTWLGFYEVYVKDKYDLGLKEFFDRNPYALQSIVARMLEAIRKEYWNAPEEVKIDLAKELRRLQQEYGFTCCHHTCGNLELLNYAAGILSSIQPNEQIQPKEETIQPKEEKSTIHRGGGGGAGRLITLTPAQKSEATNQTATGFGFEVPVESKGEVSKAEEVAGYKVEVSEKTSGFEISATPIVAILLVVLALLIFYVGIRRKI